MYKKTCILGLFLSIALASYANSEQQFIPEQSQDQQPQGYWKRVKNAVAAPAHWVAEKFPTEQIMKTGKFVVTKPTTWAVVGATAYGTHLLGQQIGKQNALLTVGSAFGALTVTMLINWIRLRSRYLELIKKQTSTSDPYVRNVWYNPLSKDGKAFEDGYHMVQTFNEANERQKHLIKQSFLKQLGVGNDMEAMKVLDTALAHLKDDLSWYRNYSNIQYTLSRAAGFSTPDELLTSDVLIENDMNGALRNVFDRSTEFGLYSVRLDWWELVHLPKPAVYTWNYSMASLCVWHGLEHYSLVKAMRKIIETPIEHDDDRSQNHNVIIKYQDEPKSNQQPPLDRPLNIMSNDGARENIFQRLKHN